MEHTAKQYQQVCKHALECNIARKATDIEEEEAAARSSSSSSNSSSSS